MNFYKFLKQCIKTKGILLMISNLIVFNSFSQQELKYEIRDTFVSSVLSSINQELIHYVTESNWYTLSKTDPFEIESINLKDRTRKKWQFPISESRKIYASSIYADDQYLALVISDRIMIVDQNTSNFIEFKFNDDIIYSHCGIHNDTLLAYGVYNYHINDSWPMLQVGLASIKDNKWTKSNFYLFSGVEYTPMVQQFTTYNEGSLYYITPFSNYIYHIDHHLDFADSIKIDNHLADGEAYFDNSKNDNYTSEVIKAKMNKSLKDFKLRDNAIKEELMQLKSIDSLRTRNEKLLFNGQTFIVTNKPKSIVDWSKRALNFIEHNQSSESKYYESNLDRTKDFNKPIFVNSNYSYLLENMMLAQPNSFQFYDPSIQSREEYDQRLNEWATENEHYYYTLFMYKLIVNE